MDVGLSLSSKRTVRNTIEAKPEIEDTAIYISSRHWLQLPVTLGRE